MAPERIVINTGPLIAFARVGVLEVIGQLPYEFLTPQEVRYELDQGAKAGHPRIEPSWLRVERLQEAVSPIATSALDLGEAAVIQLALDRKIDLVCIDEWKGRRVALATGLRVTGALGLLGKAKLLGLVPSLRLLVDRAVSQGIRYHPEIVRQTLEAVGEK